MLLLDASILGCLPIRLDYVVLDTRSANNIGADQPAHPRILVSALVIHFLQSIIS